MNNLEKYFLITAICVIAISLFMIGLQRYEPYPGTLARFDKWTGKIEFEK